MMLLALYVGAYLLGAVPFAVIIGRAKGVDIFAIGSGNPGMTNVMRALGTGWGIACFVLDVLKGLIPALVARQLVTQSVGSFDAQFIWFTVGVASIAGHCLSPFLGFRGGKGVSTALGAVIGASPVVALACFTLFVVLLAASRLMSLASVVAVASVVPFGWLLPGQSRELIPIYLALALFVAYRHRRNFSRIRAGTEPRFSFGKTLVKPDTEPNPAMPTDEIAQSARPEVEA